MATYNLWDGIPDKLLTGDILNYTYRNSDGRRGQSLQMTLPKGIYRLEAWGSGAGYFEERLGGWSAGTADGSGGYAVGTLTLSAAATVFLTPGGVGYNGGQARHYSYSTRDYYFGSGGGSDIRIGQNSLYHRVLTAGGGGQSGYYTNTWSGVGGDLNAGGGGGASGLAGGSGRYGQGGTQTGGGATGAGYNLQNHWYSNGIFGAGGYWQNSSFTEQGMGGGGWYGGGAGGTQTTGTAPNVVEYVYPGGGGSGFVLTSSTAGSVPSGYALGSSYWLTDASTISGQEGSTITEPDGTTAAAGHRGEGYIRITVIQGQLASPTVTGITYPTEGTVQIAFTAVTNASAYKVYDGSGNLLSTISSSPYTETGIDDGEAYTRQIAAWSASYAESEPTVVNYTSQGKLDTPTNLRASYTSTSTTIQWNAVTGASSYTVKKNGTTVASVNTEKYVDSSAGAGVSVVYTVTAKASGRWDSDAASISTVNKPQLPNVTNLNYTQTVSTVILTWAAASGATGYDVYRDGTKVGSTSTTSYTDIGTNPGTNYVYTVYAKANGYYNSTGASITVAVRPQIETPDLIEASQTSTDVVLNWTLRNYGTTVTYTLKRDGVTIYQGHAKTYSDTGLTTGQTYIYSLTAAIPGSGYYDSNPAVLYVLVGRDLNTIERQKDYLKQLRTPFIKLCRLRFLNPNGTTAYALDNNPRNKRSHAFIASGTVTANLQNGQRLSATVTLDNADLAFETTVNKVWFGQEIALDEGLVLSDGSEYYRQTGVFVIDNPQETIDPKTKSVTYRLLDKWAELDGTLGGKLEGTYEVPVGTNIFEPITELLAEDRGNGLPLDNMPPVYTEYYNGKTQELTDGTVASMTDSPYTLTVNGDGGTKAQIIIGLAGMVNAWVGYDNTGRLRVDPSQDDILDINKPVLWRFTPEEAQLLGMTYTVKKEDVYNDYIVVGEMLDDYSQPGGRATNYDPRSDTNVYLIGRKTKYESASGYATSTQCRDLAEWRLKRSSVLQKAVSISCIQMMHIDLNSLVEIVRTDKPGSPVERHLIQGFTRPLAYNGAMTISAVSVNDYPVATVTEWPPEPEPTEGVWLRFSSNAPFSIYPDGQVATWDGTMEYSTDGENWQEWNGIAITSGAGNNLYLRGTGNTVLTDYRDNAGWHIIGSGVSAYGTIEALLDWETVQNGGHPAMAAQCCRYMFYSCEALVKAPELTAMTLSTDCYMAMFASSGITEPPELPATTLATYCYDAMFSGCETLKKAAAMPATTLAPGCCISMYSGCTALEELPVLPAEQLEPYCYMSMFQNCTQIKLSSAQTGSYTTQYRIPSGGNGTTATMATYNMFSGTGGSFTGDPSVNTAYYTSNTIVTT